MAALSALFLMAAAAAAQPPDPSAGRVWPGVAAGWLKACGFQDVILRYDQTLQEYVIRVSAPDNATDDQLGCAARASLNSDYYVDFTEPLNGRYQWVYWPMAEDAGRRGARVWLQRHGLLKKLPPYVPGRTNDLTYARKLERMCGPGASGAFTLDDGFVTLRPATAKHGQLDDETSTCLTNALWASGLPTGLVGGYYPPE